MNYIFCTFAEWLDKLGAMRAGKSSAWGQVMVYRESYWYHPHRPAVEPVGSADGRRSAGIDGDAGHAGTSAQVQHSSVATVLSVQLEARSAKS